MLDYLNILPEVLGLLATGGWLVSRWRRRQESEEHKAKLAAMEAKITTTLRDSETKYTREALEIYTDNVVKPLKDELKTIRENQIRLQTAINLAPTCRLFPDCVIVRRLRSTADDNHEDPKRSEELDGHDDFDSCAEGGPGES